MDDYGDLLAVGTHESPISARHNSFAYIHLGSHYTKNCKDCGDIWLDKDVGCFPYLIPWSWESTLTPRYRVTILKPDEYKYKPSLKSWT